MNAPSGKFLAAAIVALIYLVVAAGFIREDRKSHTGGFINLQGMISALATLPVAFPLEYWGHKLDFRSNWQMGAAVGLCAGLIFAGIFGSLSLFEFIWFRPIAPA